MNTRNSVIGFIGLGAMGSRMARRLIAACFKVVVFDRSQEKMKAVAARGRQSFTGFASVVAISLAAVVLVTIRPVCAQTDDGFVPARSIEHHGILMTSNLDDPWDVTPPSLADPALSPAAREPVEPPLPQMNETFMPRVDGGLVEPWDDSAIPYTQPMVVSRPNSIALILSFRSFSSFG